MRRPRITGPTGERMINAALGVLLGSMWDGGAGQIGLNVPRGDWRHRMRGALEVAFDELLKEPEEAGR